VSAFLGLPCVFIPFVDMTRGVPDRGPSKSKFGVCLYRNIAD
jgi:hypothetical protein